MLTVKCPNGLAPLLWCGAPEESVADPTASAKPEGTGTGGPQTILLVEDLDSLRKLTREYLESFGYRVLDARGGPEALQIAKEHPRMINLLVTDVIMPGMLGPELADRLSAMRPGIRVLYLSGYTDEAIARHGVLEPGVHFLEKPFSIGDLLEKVRLALDDPRSLDGTGRR